MRSVRLLSPHLLVPLGAALLSAALTVPRVEAAPDVRFVPNVVNQFNALTVRPDAMGFYRGASPDPTMCKHYQGIVRLDAPDGTPYFYVTRSGNIANVPWLPDAQACGEIIGSDDPGNLLVVRMDSRDRHGERLRSNRIQRGIESMHTPPEIEDRTVAHFTFDGAGQWPNYGHPGGMQAVGEVVALALETPYESGLPHTAILFFDATNREMPQVTSLFALEDGVQAGLVGLTPIADGRFLMVLTGGTNDVLWFYESQPSRPDGSTDLASPSLQWTLVDTWSEAEDGAYLGADWPNEGGASHQTLHFLREGDMAGDLYLAGARGKFGFGEDWLDLYRVDRVEGQIKLKLISARHKNSHPALDPSFISPGNNTASFAAASAYHVSPTGELLFYATEHDNDGAYPYNGIPLPCPPCGSVKMGEWRHIEMVRPGSPTYLPSARVDAPNVVDEGMDVQMTAEGVPAITRAWLQLWAGSLYSGRYLVMDYADRHKDNFDDFKDLEGSNADFHSGFDNEPSSMLAYAPVGCTIRVNDDDFGDGNFPGTYTRTLPGTGTVFRAPRLSQVRNDDDSGSIDEELTSAQFFGDCDDLYAQPVSIMWDLADDGQYDVLGDSALLSGAVTDGPEVRNVRVRADHGNRATAALTEITVRNVAPSITSVSMIDALGQRIGQQVAFALVGLPVRLQAAFTDPGRLDTQIASVIWGDGSVSHDADFDEFRDAYGQDAGWLTDTYSYAAPGDYVITVSVEDDDGGVGTASAGLQIFSAAGAVGVVIEGIDSILAGSLPPAVADALADARQALDGASGGLSSSGAIDKIEADSVQAALVKLEMALDDLTASEEAGAGDLSALKMLLLLVIQLLQSV